MPIKSSAKKSLRVAQHKTSVNRYRKTLIKAALKNVTAETASKAVSMIDKGVKWHLFHPNKAARMKSALTKKLPSGAKLTPKIENKPTATKTKVSAAKPANKTTKISQKSKIKSQNNK